MHCLVQKYILRFDISMHDPQRVEVGNCLKHLLEERLGLLFSKDPVLSASDVLIQGVSTPILHYQVYLHIY